MIKVDGLTKAFTSEKGLFDLHFEVNKGEVFGYIGPNGAGKSTTIRHLMGFMKPDSGHSSIHGLDCWKNSAQIQKLAGYLPGEIVFLEGMTGLSFLTLIQQMRKQKETKRRDELIERFQLDVKTPIRKMSKGMKQKVGIIAAFMHEPEVLILDEPTSGLDPLMQRVFIDLILEEKMKNKTILMSSHSFHEIERTCDSAGIIKDGRLVAYEDMHSLRTVQRRVFEVKVRTDADIEKMVQSSLLTEVIGERTVHITVQGNDQEFIQLLSQCEVQHLDTRPQDLEDIFMHYYDRREVAK
ncbi:ABC transporter ATP-binding protein [Fictibacillus phosphorivorans]|uniref:ABC transporter ATP-binding protein n=1 Tax=Fictibacillus phosphorivorans TaxID=1221500 RepID=A0A161TJG4_9BACL|nr:ABC transporter ATP-binding protein [Fictibacillus phosphorivorans]KZE69384.1 ABC transporter ATP-binding protein [Fictibacillus phosphorivorans]